jgi:5'-nucleotidase
LRRTRLFLTTATALAAAVAVGLPGTASAAPNRHQPTSVTQRSSVQLIAMNDFHGRISEMSPTSSDSKLTTPGRDGRYGTADDGVQIVGGSADVATTVSTLEKRFHAASGGKGVSYFVGAGDLVSASPFESSIFKDEPTVEVLNKMGLDVSSVGNHEFDRGTTELRRLSAPTDGYEAAHGGAVGACDGVVAGETGCWTDSTGTPFHGTDYPYLAANVVSKETGDPLLPPYQLFDTGNGKKIALIGVVTTSTPTIVSPDGIADVRFIDEADAVNHWTNVLTTMGVKAIGVLIHEGGTNGGADKLSPNGCDSLTGPIVDINNRISKDVDFIVSAHTHQMYNCLLPVPNSRPRLVTQAGYYGRLVTDIRLTIDSRTGDVDRGATYRATNVPVDRQHPDKAVQAIVNYWNARSAVAGNVVVGSITADITRAYGGVDANGKPIENRGGESSLGNLVADAQLAAMQQDQYGHPVIAFMNPGGLRTDLDYEASEGGEQPGEITYRELFNVQPFGNTVNAATLTGADIKQVLEEQFQADQKKADGGRESQLILGTNEGFGYSYDLTRPYGDRVLADTITLNGVTIDPAQSYRVVMNSFLAAGGDSFTAFTSGTDPVTGPVDVDTAVDYFKNHGGPVSPPPADHATQIGG